MRFFGLVLVLLVACTVDHNGLITADAAGIDVQTPDSATADTGTQDVLGFDGGGDSGPVAVDAGPDSSLAPDAGFDGGFDAGFDAGTDAGPIDPCTVGPDSDLDGVVDACDECRGFDDNDDLDADGIADGCDDWPCGARPTVSTNVAQEQIRIRNVDIEGMGNTAVIRPSETFRISFDYSINDVGCPGCIDQIEWGFTRIGRLGCVYSGNPPNGGDSGSAMIPNIPIPPGAQGLYELRFNLGQDFVCGMRDWWDSEPGPAHTVGVVCVPPVGGVFAP